MSSHAAKLPERDTSKDIMTRQSRREKRPLSGTNLDAGCSSSRQSACFLTLQSNTLMSVKRKMYARKSHGRKHRHTRTHLRTWNHRKQTNTHRGRYTRSTELRTHNRVIARLIFIRDTVDFQKSLSGCGCTHRRWRKNKSEVRLKSMLFWN